jgi:predicted amidophosphoribosyltransferase
MSEQDGAASLVRSDALLDLFKRLLGFRLCVGTRWKCDNAHEWVSAHCDSAWFQMPTTCPECGRTATAHRGEWMTFNQWSNASLSLPRCERG